MVHHVEGRPYPHDADNKARIYDDEKGHLWVSHEDLLNCDYRGIEDFDVVYLNGKFYELQGYIHGARAWWIEEVELDAEQTQEASAEPEAREAAKAE